MRIIFVIILTALIISCGKPEDGHYTIPFKNNSGLRLYIYGDVAYPDTSIWFGSITTGNSFRVVNPESVNNLALQSRKPLEDDLQAPNGTLMVFVFDADLIEKVPWDTVSKKYLILKRYDLTLKDLKKMNWTITYP